MRALAIVADHEKLDWASMSRYYAAVEPGKASPQAVNTVFQQLLMSLHHLAALRELVNARSDHNLCRMGIVAWYYGIYCASSAMIAAKEGSIQDNHAGTARRWEHFPTEAQTNDNRRGDRGLHLIPQWHT
jgi:hypothetical protein